jgi:hypothetical protein
LRPGESAARARQQLGSRRHALGFASKPWPSAEARERVIDLGAHKHGSPHPSSYGALIKKAMAGCQCLVDCDQISKNRVNMIVLPLLAKGRASRAASSRCSSSPKLSSD